MFLIPELLWELYYGEGYFTDDWITALLLERAVSVWQLRALLLNSFEQEEEPIVISEESEDSFQSWSLARSLG